MPSGWSAPTPPPDPRRAAPGPARHPAPRLQAPPRFRLGARTATGQRFASKKAVASFEPWCGCRAVLMRPKRPCTTPLWPPPNSGLCRACPTNRWPGGCAPAACRAQTASGATGAHRPAYPARLRRSRRRLSTSRAPPASSSHAAAGSGTGAMPRLPSTANCDRSTRQDGRPVMLTLPASR